MIRVEGITKIYKTGTVTVPALRGIDFQVERGEFVSIVGPSGCGKSTLLYILGGLLRATSGSVVINGFDLTGSKDAVLTRFRRDHIGFVFQKFNLIGSLTVFDNLKITCRIMERPNNSKERIESTLHDVGVGHKSGMKPLELSQGEQQRVAIARALIKEPKVLLADEPTGNLDSKNSENIVRLFDSLSKERGQTVLMITHNEALADMSDRKIEIIDGRTVTPQLTETGSHVIARSHGLEVPAVSELPTGRISNE